MTIDRQKLVDALKSCARFVGSATSAPYLRNALFTGTHYSCTISATDGRKFYERYIPCVGDNGTFAISPQRLLQLLNSCTDELVHIIVDDNAVIVYSGGAQVQLSKMSVDDFPPFPRVTDPVSFEITASNLRNAISKIIFAASILPYKTNINGMNVELRDGMLCCTCTDGHRLSFTTAEVTEVLTPGNESIQALIPLESVVELRRILDGLDCAVMVNINDQSAEILIGIKIQNNDGVIADERVVTSLALDRFPSTQTQSILEKDNPNKVRIDTGALISTIKRAMSVIDYIAPAVVLKADANTLNISVRSTYGKYVEDIECQYDGEPVEVMLNPNYLLDALGVSASKVVIGILDDTSPVTIQDDEEEPTSKHVIMPLGDTHEGRVRGVASLRPAGLGSARLG